MNLELPLNHLSHSIPLSSSNRNQRRVGVKSIIYHLNTISLFQTGEQSVTQDQTLQSETLCSKECLGVSIQNRQTAAQKVK